MLYIPYVIQLLERGRDVCIQSFHPVFEGGAVSTGRERQRRSADPVHLVLLDLWDTALQVLEAAGH